MKLHALCFKQHSNQNEPNTASPGEQGISITSLWNGCFYFGAPFVMSFLMTFPPFITNLTR